MIECLKFTKEDAMEIGGENEWRTLRGPWRARTATSLEEVDQLLQHLHTNVIAEFERE